MLFAIDIGNTNIVLGIFNHERLVQDFRCETRRNRTVDEYACLFFEMLSMNQITCSMIDSSVICSVVPPLQPIISETVKRLFSIDPFIVSWEVDTGIHILYTHPQEVGADRIVNAVAAFERYRHAAIIVDFGTATTFDVISAKGEYLGGTISPGIGISMEALFMYTAKLPKVEFKKPEDVIGKNTIQSIQSGTYYGYIGLVEGLIRRIREKLPDPVKVIATGGLASLVFRDCKMIDEVDDNLTLHGLRIVFERMIHAHKT